MDIACLFATGAVSTIIFVHTRDRHRRRGARGKCLRQEMIGAGKRGRFFLLRLSSFRVGLDVRGRRAILGCQVYGWKAMFLASEVVRPCWCFRMSFLMPESPRWLASRWIRITEADDIVAVSKLGGPGARLLG